MILARMGGTTVPIESARVPVGGAERLDPLASLLVRRKLGDEGDESR